MDPELLLAEIKRLKDEGVPAKRINEALGNISEGRFSTIADVEKSVQRRQPREEIPGGLSGLSDLARLLGQGATFGFADELAGLGAGLVPGGKSRAEATQASRDRIARLQAERPVASRVAQGAGSLVPTGLIGRAAQGVGLLGRAGQAGGILRGGKATTPLRAGLRAAARGAGIGAAEGAAFGAGAAEGGVGPRVKEAAKTAAISAPITGLLAGGIGSLGSIRSAARLTRESGEHFADDIIELQGHPTLRPSQVSARAQALRTAARKTFRELEEEGANMAPEITQRAMDNPVIRSEVRKVAPEVAESFDAFAAGEAGSVRPLTFAQADDVAKNLKAQADFFAKGGGGARPGRSDIVRKASRAFDELDEAMRESLEGFDEAKGMWARQAREMRSMSEGRTMWGKSADDMDTALQGKSDEERRFFRAGLVAEATRELERFRGSKGVLGVKPPAAVDKMLARGPGFNDELRHLFPTEEAFQEFSRRVDLVEANASFTNRAATLAQAIAFIGGGTSLLGRLVTN